MIFRSTVYIASKSPEGPGFKRVTWRAGDVCSLCRLRVLRGGEWRNYVVCQGHRTIEDRAGNIYTVGFDGKVYGQRSQHASSSP